jgi:hypothetical protein
MVPREVKAQQWILGRTNKGEEKEVSSEKEASTDESTRRYQTQSSHKNPIQSLIHTISNAILNRNNRRKRKCSFNINLLDDSIIMFDST